MSRFVYDNGQLSEEWDDAARTYRRFVEGVLVEERPFTAAEAEAPDRLSLFLARQAVRSELFVKALAALEVDLTYLALNPPTTGQAVVQVERLTRQVVALIRLITGAVDSTAGT